MDLLRGRRLGRLARDAAEYTTSVASDRELVEQVIKINKAHMAMLLARHLVDPTHGARCLTALAQVPRDPKLDPELEDVHMNVEAFVVSKAGEEAGGQLHLAKSRNDQVASAIRMRLRDHVLTIISGLIDLRSALLDVAVEHLHTVMPGYTHLQHAQPVTLAHHLLAHHDAFQRDCDRLVGAYDRINRSPMGAAALATTGFAIDRELTSRLLGFDGLVENSIDAVSSRDFALEALSDFAIAMINLSRLAEELILWSTREFGVAEVSDRYASTSSIMPQKKNPVVAELMRAKAATVCGDLSASLTLMKALPMSYNLDLQELSPHLWSGCQATLSSIKIAAGVLQTTKFDPRVLRRLVSDDQSTATDLADYLVKKYGVAFRVAHHIVGKISRQALAKGEPLVRAAATSLPSLLRPVLGKSTVITEAELKAVLTPEQGVASRSVIGGPSPAQTAKALTARRAALKRTSAWLARKRRLLRRADAQLDVAVGKEQGGEK